ncbi:MAG: glutathione synthase [Alphaproteobacteria bacterium]
MSLTVAIQMDPLAGINALTDSSLLLGWEAQRRGHRVVVYQPEALAVENGRVRATGHEVTLRMDTEDWFDEGRRLTLDLAKDVDVVLIRQDPPVDMAYLATLHFLELVKHDTLVLNDPSGIRSSPEKLITNYFPDLIPDTVQTLNVDEIMAFRAKHGDIILKPLFGRGGEGVFYLKRDDSNLSALIELFEGANGAPLIAQQFLPDISSGDKRIILFDGEPVGALNRLPPEGEIRSNMAAGGSAHKTEISDREREICARLKPTLVDRGLYFAGIDVIGGYLTEVNVTSPTGLQAINRIDGVNLEQQYWDGVEARLS